MSVSATGGPGRPLHPASSHSGGKRSGPGSAVFPALGGQEPGTSAPAAEEGQTPTAADRDARAGREVAGPASVSPHDAYAAHQLAKRLADAGGQRTGDGEVAAHRPRGAASRFDVGPAADDALLRGDDGVDVHA